MAAGDILSCEVLATGWQAKVVVEGFKDGGAYSFGDIDTAVANAKFAMTVISEGYSTAGVLGTKTRTVYGTRVVQKAYPNQAVAEETEVGANVELTIALSDYVYDDDKNGGAGTSLADPTLSVSAGWYTDSGTGGTSAGSNAATNLNVTNSSTQDYPKVVARWAVVPYQRFTSTFDLEAVAFHRFAESGNPVACVKFTAEDTGVTREAITATAMVKSSAADSLPCYKGTLTATAYTDNAVVTANFTAYPWVGDAASVATSVGGSPNALTLGPLPLLADFDDDYGVTHACVNTSTGSDTGTKAFSSLASAQASPCLTVRYALAQIAAFNNTTYARNNANAGMVYLQSNNHSWGDGVGAPTTADVWATITRDPNVAKANACISGAPNGIVATARVKLLDITIIPTGFIFQGAVGRVIWLDRTTYAPTVQSNSFPVWGYDVTYNTFCTSDLMNNAWSNYSTGNIAALIRGCSATNGVSLGSGIYAARCILTTTLDHNDAQAGIFTALPVGNTIVAYNRDLRNPENGNGSISATAAIDDVAVVCNLFEDTAGTAPTALLWGDSSVVNNNNALIWHNTMAGERANVGYNDGASAVTRTGFSIKYNSFQRFATKHDEFKLDGTRTGAWSVLYGVGSVGNHQEYTGTSFIPNYFGIRSTRNAAAGYTSDLSGAAGAGGGNYTPTTASVLVGKIASATDIIIPWDINGLAYESGGAAGAITLALGQPLRKRLGGILHAGGASPLGHRRW